jgi:hypothetical protein
MRLIAKAALGALALASFGFGVSAPASAQVIIHRSVIARPGVVITRPGVVVTHPCLRPLSLRPAFCFRSGRMAFLTRPSWRERMLLRRHFRREAMLNRRFGY